jgi:serine phosphatase RsbU (regulator of sigma subunit)/anti-sigma regulatory factor (Ser/Thr protein kinase)
LIDDVAGIELGWPALRDRVRTLLAAPLTAGGELVGGIVVGSRESAFTPEDRLLLGLVADRIALAVRYAREHERERDVAITLQRSMLPRGLPAAEGVDLAARYVPARERLEVGGDWYDALPLRDGRLALVIGDVAGKGLEAAAVMGQLRNALRAYLVEGRGPADALAHLDALMLHIRLDQMATAAVVIVDPASGRLVYSLAGHPPPLLAVDGEPAQLLEGGRTPPVGVLRDVERTEAAVEIAGSFTLVLYTDGLAERRQQPIDVLLERLLRTLERETSWAERTCERLLTEALGDQSPEDDVALLALRHGAPVRLRLAFPAAGQELAPARRELRRWLQTTPLDDRARDDVLLAAGEACANAVEHAYDGAAGTVELVAAVDGDAVDLVVTDHGHWREPRPSTRGRGLGIMRRLVDDVDVETGEAGTRVHLRRSLASVRA